MRSGARTLRRFAALGGAALLLAALTQCQRGPLLRIVVGFPPGGSLDVLARVLAEQLEVSLGQRVIVENRTGAGGIVGNVWVKSAVPDGQTLVLVTSSNMVNYPFTHDALPYDPLADFAPIAQLVEFPIAMALSASVPAADLREFLTLAAAQPRYAACGSPAPGTLSHFFCLELARAAGLQLLHVPYRGSGPLGAALLAGEVPTAFSTPLDIAAMTRSGQARLLAVSSAARSPLLPDVPTFREQGYDIEGSAWYGLFAPARTPSATLARLARAALEAVKNPVVAQRLQALGLQPAGLGPAQLAQRIRRDTERWRPVIEASGFKASE